MIYHKMRNNLSSIHSNKAVTNEVVDIVFSNL